jgi:hypothetical protein
MDTITDLPCQRPMDGHCVALPKFPTLMLRSGRREKKQKQKQKNLWSLEHSINDWASHTGARPGTL